MITGKANILRDLFCLLKGFWRFFHANLYLLTNLLF